MRRHNTFSYQIVTWTEAIDQRSDPTFAGQEHLTSTRRARAPRLLCLQRPSMRRPVLLSPLLVLPSLLGLTDAISPTFPNGTEQDNNGTDTDAQTAKSRSESIDLDSFCSAQLSSFTATYKSTEIATSRWTWYEGFGPTDSLGDLTGSVTSQTYWTSTFLCKLCTIEMRVLLSFHCLVRYFSLPFFAMFLILAICSLSRTFNFASLPCYKITWSLFASRLAPLTEFNHDLSRFPTMQPRDRRCTARC